MPTRSRQANTRAAAQVEEEEAAYSIPGLDYTESLSWPAGKPIAVADLFTRLQKLSTALKDTEQGSVEVKDITKLAQDLAHSNLLGHKDKGIRAWTVACVVDVLNLCAPNAPYRPNQLKEIFTAIIYTILPALADPSNAYNAQHQYVLDQLVDAQSIVLITDLQDAENLISQLFTVCFDVVSGSGKNTAGMELAQSVVFQLTMLLNSVVDEANLPEDVVDIIISQFLRVDPRTAEAPAGSKKKAAVKDKTQSTLILKDYPPAYNLAKSVCTACSDKMSTAISQYFSTIITTASSVVLTGEDGKSKASSKRLPNVDDDEDEEDNVNDLRKAHRLVKELWRACPDVLANVVPQIELELAADSIRLRELAVATIGDLVAGVGLAGLPDLSPLDPTAFPLPTIENADLTVLSTNPLLKPSAPKPFIHVHTNTYQAFMGRRIDKAVEVRVAWVQAAARILLTRAGGIGLNDEELSALIAAYTKMLKDIDERVRSTALRSLEVFPYHAVIEILGSDGGLSEQSSLLSTVAERVTDKRHMVRDEAMLLLGTVWGVASRDIGNGNERVCAILGQAPTKLLSAMFVKDANITMKLPEVLFERLIPISYPPIKGKVAISETQGDGDVSESSVDPDTLRVRRLVTLIRDLDERAKAVFFGLQKRQADLQKGMNQFLDTCEKYNGGVADSAADEETLNRALTRYVDSFARLYPDSTKASADIWKFIKANDRRNYQLIRFAIGAENDYRTMFKAIRELTKRVREGGASLSSVLDTLTPLIYQSAMINYNRSHIAAVMELTKSTDAALADTAQEVLKQISDKVPEVMKSHIQVLCKELEEAAPSDKIAEIGSSTDSLKACSAFAKKFPDELPKDRKFVAAVQSYALYSSSSASAKHAVTIILSAFDKKELRSKEILSKAIKRCKAEPKNKVTQLAAIAQACRLAPAISETEELDILAVAKSTLEGGERSEESYHDSAWSESTDNETAAKEMALKIYLNRCRRVKADELAATEAISKLTSIIKDDGETVSGDSEGSSPSVQRNRLRLTAARYLLKLCRNRQQYEQMVTPQMFHTVAWILVSPPYGVRGGLVRQLKKYLSSDQLASRWLTILFLLPFEPDEQLRASTMAWLKSRLAHYTRIQQSAARANGEKKAPTSNVMESVFSRLISLLAYHPDFPVKGEGEYNGQLLDFANYFIFYLRSVATEDNLSLIFHIAQRVKQAADAISQTAEVDEHLYILSDLAQATIRNYADLMPGSSKGMNILQAWPGKAHLPNNLFQAIRGSAKAQEIASKNYLPEEVALGLETLVRKAIRNRFGTSNKAKSGTTDRKRKSSVSVDLDDDEVDTIRKSAKKSRSAKKPSRTSLTIRETPNAKKRKSEHVMSVEQPSRKSARTSTAKKVSYEESDEEEDDNDTDNIVKYKPAPVEKYKHKSRERQAATPDIEEEDEDEDVIEEADAEAEEVGSPTPAGKVQDASEEEDADVEMTNGDHETPTNEDEEEIDDVDETAEDEADAQVEEKDEEEEEAEPTPPPATKRGGRTTRAQETPKSAPTSTKKAQTKVTSQAAETPASKSKVTKKAGKGKAAQPASSPPPESARRSSRRSKVAA